MSRWNPRTYKVSGDLNGSLHTETHSGYFNAQWAFRRVRRKHPTISQMKAELVSAQ